MPLHLYNFCWCYYVFVTARDLQLESLFRDLPEVHGPQVFLERLTQEHPKSLKQLERERGLFSDVLALTAWSPLLGTTLEQNPEYISWLARERSDTRVRSLDDLRESLARFAMTHSSLPAQAILARFRRRELLRTYLHDIRGTHTVVETTEELSNVADVVLDYALNLARQELDNRYGPPRRLDERGRDAIAEFAIVALGKLGSFELNYASDIDLFFLYSDEGNTSGSGERGEVTNREYFVKLAETVAKIVGQPGSEAAAFRVDLRLRPHGRDGALACSLDETVRYYRSKAQSWELQTLIRSRASAGSPQLFQNFVSQVRNNVFRRDVSVADALASVRMAKQKIDRHRERDAGGFNVKLDRGGIRNIEFIAQALQLAHAGRDEWLRAPHTLVSLGRLADRNLITEQERTELSDAYDFLRRLEHRLQMEHGLQTHTLPSQGDQRALVARRMNFKGENATAQFESALSHHLTNVRRAFDRVFEEHDRNTETSATAVRPKQQTQDSASVLSLAAANSLLPHLFFEEDAEDGAAQAGVEVLARTIREVSRQTRNEPRALAGIARMAASLDKTSPTITLPAQQLGSLVHFCGASEFFGEILASNPALAGTLNVNVKPEARRDFRSVLRAAVDPEKNLAAELSAFRRQWASLLLEIGMKDATGKIPVSEANRLQTELATASLNVAYLIARREMIRRYGRLTSGPRIAVFGLGRLGSGGVDYGSDLDIIVVYDSLVPSPVETLTREEANARLTEIMLAALSSVTREGYLYRVDLRLRPNGQSGPLVSSSDGFIEYAKKGTDVWEWLAYVKLRTVAGDLELGRMIETHARHAIHENARRADVDLLKRETRSVRDRLERAKSKRQRGALDIKYAAGGMLDVYFATRFLQLRDDVSDEGEDRSTQGTLDRLAANGSLEQDDYTALVNGYALLRSVDHQLRLILGRSGRVPAGDHTVMREIAEQLSFSSARALEETLSERMNEIRAAYDRITN